VFVNLIVKDTTPLSIPVPRGKLGHIYHFSTNSNVILSLQNDLDCHFVFFQKLNRYTHRKEIVVGWKHL